MSDIRNFLIKKRKVNEEIQESSHVLPSDPSTSMSLPTLSSDLSRKGDTLEETVQSDLDIGMYLNKHINDKERLKLLKTHKVPSIEYNFKKDVDTTAKRAFRLEWLTIYPWISYSAAAKGPFCRLCVLFRPVVHWSLLGAFIVKPCTQYNKFNELAKGHASTQWHRDAMKRSENFLSVASGKQADVYQLLNSAHAKEIDANRVKLRSIIASIIFCACHDLPFRGKTDCGSVFTDLLHFRVNSGDKILQQHLESGAKNALYISHQSQNEIIDALQSSLRETLINEVKEAQVFSVLADETADIAGIEQISIGIRYLYQDENNIFKIHEEFMGFSALSDLDAKSISKVIMKTIQDLGLDLNLLVGQGYDGCATMSGQLGGVQKIIRDLYPKAIFFHCASHRLNLVINDTNKVNEIRNTVGTIKEIIKFFRESTLRRNMVPNIPLLCETRWSAKHKAIRIFKEKFKEIIAALENIAENGNSQTRQKAHMLYTAATNSIFVVALHTIALYSSKLEPVTTALQEVQLDLQSLNTEIGKLMKIFHRHREHAEENFKLIFQDIKKSCDLMNIDLKLPRIGKIMTHKSNQPADSIEEYFRRSIFIPYLDSIICALNERFSESHSTPFSLLQLHPREMKLLTKTDFLKIATNLEQFYGNFLMDNFISEASTWYETWAEDDVDTSKVEYIDLLDKAKRFYPAIFQAIKIGLTLPITTCPVERSFSTLRKVKTWTRSTMSEERLSGLCMMSLHRKRIDGNEEFVNASISKFAEKPRRLQFLFLENDKNK